MPRSLVSYWKRVAVSGPTADRREITVQELRDIAETYKPSRYTAVIWADHERWSGSHGTVFAVRLVEDDPELEEGQVALEAQLKPNDKLLQLNDRGEKLFTSIEIYPDFAGSGKAYLTGLAVTDEPASLGTQELYFSRRTSDATYYAASVELGQLRDEEPDSTDTKGLITALTTFFKRFAAVAPTETPQTPTESTPPMDEATAKALKALLEQLLLVAAGIQTVIEPVAEEVDETESEEQVDAVESAVTEIVEQAEADREFSRRRKASKGLEARLAGIEKQFSALLNTTQGRTLPRSTGAAAPAKKKVL
ncbi:GPO family capsid scaffolding protein [Pseudomonas sp. URMO17WK12:I2]|uniref:GPO family capsid scaffolding protein n=1 Tax=Pseudomonas sp. URMO17WK12:I2 TaxID=1261623 RepID=UPI000DAEA76C|nr:GPO family capsid scaffolding protein [Pseudomonas sp. URMO17WK12:I2]PZW49714.1 capsid scaffolding serine peptidase GPO [Pseudomonas sp. URMO17WK12:I2]